MVEKKATTKAATKKATAKKAPAKKAPATKTPATKSSVLYLNAENAGFRAGDVYQALAAADHALTIAEIAKSAEITKDEVILGIGWLFKEGKIKDEDNKVALA